MPGYRYHPMLPRPRHGDDQDVDLAVVVVGCGGTGSFLAEHLCRRCLGLRLALCLVDPDRVEEKNVGRQNFDRRDVGEYKVVALGRRLLARYPGLRLSWSPLPYSPERHTLPHQDRGRLYLVCSAVDNAAARRAVARHAPGLVLDLGNDRNSGQVLLGDTPDMDGLRGRAFDTVEMRCRALPSPYLQQPGLLTAPPQPETPPADCAEAVALGDQSATINQMMAAVGSSMVDQLLLGTLDHFASYLDMDHGSVRSVPITPEAVARVLGCRPGTLERHPPKPTMARHPVRPADPVPVGG